VQDLIRQEIFEMEVLERLNGARLLKDIVFGGGTMLRLCHGLDRYSVDLDFWLTRPDQAKPLFASMKEALGVAYQLRDAAHKYHTLLFEVRAARFPRALKIEVRKKEGAPKTESAIAYSPHASTQVLLCVLTLGEMMRSKLEALGDRKEVRDAFDIEFLLQKGVKIEASASQTKKLLAALDGFKKTDITVKLGSLLEPALRKHYASAGFQVLRAALEGLL
jgi:predicted nucleotidyltransferase component of viral defense system